MAHQLSWDNAEKTVLLQEYLDNADKEDLYNLAVQAENLLKTVNHTVHLIVDERNVELVFKTEDIKYLEKHVATNQGYVIVIPANGTESYKRMLQNMAHRFAPRAFGDPYFAKDLEEARAMLIELAQVMYP